MQLKVTVTPICWAGIEPVCRVTTGVNSELILRLHPGGFELLECNEAESLGRTDQTD